MCSENKFYGINKINKLLIFSLNILIRMNQIYVDIADEKRDQIRNDTLQLEINESQDIKITENT